MRPAGRAGHGALYLPRGERPSGVRYDVPYYPQSLDFTCGPACLVMILEHFRPEIKGDRLLELQIWREATLIFTTSGLGGTGPFGLAVAGARRGLKARVVMKEERVPFLNTVRSPEKREVISICHQQLKEEAAALGIGVEYRDFAAEDVFAALREGWLPILLVSSYYLYGDKAPHWIVVAGFDEESVYMNDPYYDPEEAPHGKDRRVPLELFRRMKRYGRGGEKSVILFTQGSLPGPFGEWKRERS